LGCPTEEKVKVIAFSWISKLAVLVASKKNKRQGIKQNDGNPFHKADSAICHIPID
jgi:hypothetical protein